ncbi:MAG: hypothetical protein MJ113_00870 [Lachnospiraceae bacterium]|nr:hypothetical protein [Lachnospiraceae bacterium]
MNCIESVIVVPKPNELDIKLYIALKGAVPEGADPLSDVEPVYALALRKLKYFGNRGSMCIEFGDTQCFDVAEMILSKTSVSMIHNVIVFSNPFEFIKEVMSEETKKEQFKRILKSVNTVLLDVPFASLEGAGKFFDVLKESEDEVGISPEGANDANRNMSKLYGYMINHEMFTVAGVNSIEDILIRERNDKLNEDDIIFQGEAGYKSFSEKFVDKLKEAVEKEDDFNKFVPKVLEDLEKLKSFLSLLDNTTISIRIRHYIAGGINDNEKSLRELFDFLKPFTNIVKVHLLPFESGTGLNYELSAEHNARIERCDKIYKSLMYDENIDYFFYA